MQGVAENTLLIFMSDNGPWLLFGDHGGSAGNLREGKATTFEGGHRVPAIAWWPGRIAPASETAHLATTMDIMPTVAGLVGSPLPSDRVIDGKDLAPILFNEPSSADAYDVFYYYFTGKLQAVRAGKWKLHIPHRYNMADDTGREGKAGGYTYPEIPLSLFDLEADIGETTNVADQHPKVVERLLALVDSARADIGDYETSSTGANARPPLQIETSWWQNPLPDESLRVSRDPQFWAD